jgi:hypothetical protein
MTAATTRILEEECSRAHGSVALPPRRIQRAESGEAPFERSVRALEALRLYGGTDQGRRKPAPPDSNASLASVLPVTVASTLRVTAADPEDMPAYLRVLFNFCPIGCTDKRDDVPSPLTGRNSGATVARILSSFRAGSKAAPKSRAASISRNDSSARSPFNEVGPPTNDRGA